MAQKYLTAVPHMIPFSMVKAEKTLARMRNNPRGWTIENIKTLAQRSGIDWRQPGTSHVTFSYPGVQPLTIPSHKPIKPIYVKLFLEMIDRVGVENDD